MRHLIIDIKVLILIIVLAFSGGWTPASAQDLPPEAYISGVIGHAQQYNLSCESRSAVDWAAYWGVWLDETEVVYGLPQTDNPETGFVGDPNGGWGAIPPASYGVHARPIAAALRSYGLPAEARSGMTWDDLQTELAAGKPVIVWVIGQMWAGTPVSYTSSDGQTLTVAAFEHSMIAIGYGEGEYGPIVHVVDAYTGYTQTYSLDTFLASWSVLGNQAVVSTAPPLEPKAESVLVPGGSYTVQPGDTLSGLARQIGVSWPDLAVLNHLTYPYTLYTGQVLQMPSGVEGMESSPASVPETLPMAEQAAAQEQVTGGSSQSTEDSFLPAEPTSPPEALQHVVAVGDSLIGIAGQYQISWQSMVDLNHLVYPYFLVPDQVLLLPEEAALSAEKDSPVPEDQSVEEDDPAETYIVQRGEYLIGLAERFGIAWEKLAEVNGIGYPYVVYAGQVLHLP